MLPSLGFSEILLLGILALVVVGPRDLPLLLRKLGRWTAKLRGMAQEFRTGFDELARQAELDELKKEVDALRRTTNLSAIAHELQKPLPTLEDYAGVAKAAPASPSMGEAASEASGGGVCAGGDDPASRGHAGSIRGPNPLSHAARDSSPIEGELVLDPATAPQNETTASPIEGKQEAEPLAQSAP